MANIHPSAVVQKHATLADDVTIGPNCVIAGGVSIGSGTVLDANVVIERDVKIGRDNRFFSNSVIGALPQVLGLTAESQIGGLVIGDGNVFHEQVTIHSSMHPGNVTRIGSDNFLMVGVHIGHDCAIEDKVVMSNCAQLSGHCKIETGAWLSGVVAMHQFVTLGKWCYIAGMAGINKDVPPFMIVSGHYPPVVRGVNKRGMQRAGLSEERQERIFEAYRKLYRRGGTLLENARALAQEDGLDENVRAIIDAITRSSQHQYGRYLETLRRR
jgi:UDP-N-acetylglucosamine acyltransferase